MGIPEISTFLRATGIDLASGQALDPFTISSRLEGHFSQDEINAFLGWLAQKQPRIRADRFGRFDHYFPFSPWAKPEALEYIARLPFDLQKSIYTRMIVDLTEQVNLLNHLDNEAIPFPISNLRNKAEALLHECMHTGIKREHITLYINKIAHIGRELEALGTRFPLERISYTSLVSPPPSHPLRFRPNPDLSEKPTLLLVGTGNLPTDRLAASREFSPRVQVVRAYLNEFPDLRVVVNVSGHNLPFAYKKLSDAVGEEGLERVDFALRAQAFGWYNGASDWPRDGLIHGYINPETPALIESGLFFKESPVAWSAVQCATGSRHPLGTYTDFEGGQYLHTSRGTFIGAKELMNRGIPFFEADNQRRALSHLAIGYGQPVGIVGHPFLGQSSLHADLSALEISDGVMITPNYQRGWDVLKSLTPKELEIVRTAYLKSLASSVGAEDVYIALLNALESGNPTHPLLMFIENHFLPSQIRRAGYERNALKSYGFRVSDAMAIPIPTRANTLGPFNSTIYRMGKNLVMFTPLLGDPLDIIVENDLRNAGYLGKVVRVPGVAHSIVKNGGGIRCMTSTTHVPLQGRFPGLLSVGDVEYLIDCLDSQVKVPLTVEEKNAINAACTRLAQTGFIEHGGKDHLARGLGLLHEDIKPHAKRLGMGLFDDGYWEFLARYTRECRPIHHPSLLGSVVAFFREKMARETQAYKAVAQSIARSGAGFSALGLMLGTLLNLEDAAQAVNFCLGLFSEQKETEHSGLASTLMPGLTALADRFA